MTATLVILGASGDLTSRLLLPGLGTLLARDTGRQLAVVGADYRDMALDAWQHLVTTSFRDAG